MRVVLGLSLVTVIVPLVACGPAEQDKSGDPKITEIAPGGIRRGSARLLNHATLQQHRQAITASAQQMAGIQITVHQPTAMQHRQHRQHPPRRQHPKARTEPGAPTAPTAPTAPSFTHVR